MFLQEFNGFYYFMVFIRIFRFLCGSLRFLWFLCNVIKESYRDQTIIPWRIVPKHMEVLELNRNIPRGGDLEWDDLDAVEYK